MERYAVFYDGEALMSSESLPALVEGLEEFLNEHKHANLSLEEFHVYELTYVPLDITVSSVKIELPKKGRKNVKR